MIYSNIITLALIAGMILVMITTNSFEKRINTLFFAGIISVLCLVIADMVDYSLQGMDVLHVGRYVSSAVGYTLRPAILAIIISILLRNKQNYIVLWIPIAVQAVIALSSRWTHWMFWFDVNNTFYRGPLGLMSHILSGCYMLALIILTMRSYNETDLGEVLTVIYGMVICAIATGIESAIKVKFILPGTMMVAISIYYLYLYTQIYKRDNLTGVLNRRSFYLDAAKWCARPMAVISMDLNGLKEINDHQGHAAGDTALKALCNAAKKAAGKQFHLYRIGGDEFMLMGVNMNESQAQGCIERIKKELRNTDYMASLGYAMYDAKCVFDEVCHTADLRMYEDKSKYKHR